MVPLAARDLDRVAHRPESSCHPILELVGRHRLELRQALARGRLGPEDEMHAAKQDSR